MWNMSSFQSIKKDKLNKTSKTQLKIIEDLSKFKRNADEKEYQKEQKGINVNSRNHRDEFLNKIFKNNNPNYSHIPPKKLEISNRFGTPLDDIPFDDERIDPIKNSTINSNGRAMQNSTWK